jgi:hypothetical protein
VAAVAVTGNWRAMRVRFIDSAQPLQELERRLPDEASRRALSRRLSAERRRVRDGTLDPEAYGALRKKLAGLVPKADQAAPTLADVERVLGETP